MSCDQRGRYEHSDDVFCSSKEIACNCVRARLGAALAAIAHLINNPFREDCFDCKSAVALIKDGK